MTTAGPNDASRKSVGGEGSLGRSKMRNSIVGGDGKSAEDLEGKVRQPRDSTAHSRSPAVAYDHVCRLASVGDQG